MKINKVLSDSDKLLLSWGYDLWDEYIDMIKFANIPKNSLILEFGTGSGRALSILLQLDYSVISIDYEENQMRKADERIKHLDNYNKVLLISDFYQTKIFEKSVKYIICANVLHETEKPKELLDIMLNALADDGKLLLWDFNSKGFEVMANLHKVIYGDIHNEGTLKIENVKDFINSEIFDILEYDTKLNKLLVITRR